MIKIISKRNGTPARLGKINSYFVVLTSELLDIGVDLPIGKNYKRDKFENCVSISLIEEEGKRKIIIEKNDNT